MPASENPTPATEHRGSGDGHARGLEFAKLRQATLHDLVAHRRSGIFIMDDNA
jgi:hypothetical protein